MGQPCQPPCPHRRQLLGSSGGLLPHAVASEHGFGPLAQGLDTARVTLEGPWCGAARPGVLQPAGPACYSLGVLQPLLGAEM